MKPLAGDYASIAIGASNAFGGGTENGYKFLCILRRSPKFQTI